MREIKFRSPIVCHNGHRGFWYWRPHPESLCEVETIEIVAIDKCDCSKFGESEGWSRNGKDQQYIDSQDMDGQDIYEGDVLRFTDKEEWYRGKYWADYMFADAKGKEEIIKKLNAEPYEERVVNLPEDYEWLLSDEIQTYWKVVGSTYENPELLNEKEG